MSMKNVPCDMLTYVINIVCRTRHRQSYTAWIGNYGGKQKAKKKLIKMLNFSRVNREVEHTLEQQQQSYNKPGKYQSSTKSYKTIKLVSDKQISCDCLSDVSCLYGIVCILYISRAISIIQFFQLKLLIQKHHVLNWSKLVEHVKLNEKKKRTKTKCVLCLVFPFLITILNLPSQRFFSFLQQLTCKHIHML